MLLVQALLGLHLADRATALLAVPLPSACAMGVYEWGEAEVVLMRQNAHCTTHRSCWQVNPTPATTCHLPRAAKKPTTRNTAALQLLR